MGRRVCKGEAMTAFTLSFLSWSRDFAALPLECREGWLSSDASFGQLRRLSATYFALRVGQGDWIIAPALELLPHIYSLPIPEPWKPSTKPNPAQKLSPTSATDLLSELGLL